jgi:glycine cleavage system H protein
MEFPVNLKYSKEHTWLLVEGDTGTVGITEFAQSELGEIVYVDLPTVGQSFKRDEIFGSVEAVKTTSDLFMPTNGEIIEINSLLKDNPSLINTEPFRRGWMIKIKLSEPDQVNALLETEAYKEMIN